MPKSKLDYWAPEIEINRKRDNDNITKLKKLGWKVIIIWEWSLKNDIREEHLANLYFEIVKT